MSPFTATGGCSILVHFKVNIKQILTLFTLLLHVPGLIVNALSVCVIPKNKNFYNLIEIIVITCSFSETSVLL